MALRKQQLKTKPVCKVSFKINNTEANGAQTAFLVGDFNDWQTNAEPMKRLKDGSFSVTLDLESGREYQFRYLLDGEQWVNDDGADRYVFNPYGNCDNSVVEA